MYCLTKVMFIVYLSDSGTKTDAKAAAAAAFSAFPFGMECFCSDPMNRVVIFKERLTGMSSSSVPSSALSCLFSKSGEDSLADTPHLLRSNRNSWGGTALVSALMKLRTRRPAGGLWVLLITCGDLGLSLPDWLRCRTWRYWACLSVDGYKIILLVLVSSLKLFPEHTSDPKKEKEGKLVLKYCYLQSDHSLSSTSIICSFSLSTKTTH